MSAGALLRVEDLVVHYHSRAGWLSRRSEAAVRAVDGVSFHLRAGETLGIVGESGCGKSSLARAVVRLVEPTAGTVWFDGEDVTAMDARRLRALRRRLQIVFQDTASSLDPRLTVTEAVREPLDIHGWDRRSAGQRVAEVLDEVHVSRSHAARYPRELSGGQRQRVSIARALALRPELLLLDEPVSALDVSVQAQILNLLEDLRAQHDLSYLFIAHDLAVIRHISDRVAVMYLGRFAEVAETEVLHAAPAHPYTAALLSAIPQPDPDAERAREQVVLSGDLPSPAAPPAGCRFHTRCPIAQPLCALEEPLLATVREQEAACHFPLARGEPLTARAGGRASA